MGRETACLDGRGHCGDRAAPFAAWQADSLREGQSCLSPSAEGVYLLGTCASLSVCLH